MKIQTKKDHERTALALLRGGGVLGGDLAFELVRKAAAALDPDIAGPKGVGVAIGAVEGALKLLVAVHYELCVALGKHQAKIAGAGKKRKRTRKK